jgi:hypothetical protein
VCGLILGLEAAFLANLLTDIVLPLPCLFFPTLYDYLVTAICLTLLSGVSLAVVVLYNKSWRRKYSDSIDILVNKYKEEMTKDEKAKACSNLAE